ncbi:hypothetical protein Q5752_004154 [Cryptotrichosporon argae]
MPSVRPALVSPALASLALPILFFAASLPLTAARTITITNACAGTIYPAFQYGTGSAPTTAGGAAQAGGWSQASGERYSFTVGDDWGDARVWARTGCTASGDALSCAIGGCADKLACSGTESGGQGATLAEFTLSGAASSSQDSFDISIVDGYNLPMTIEPSVAACAAASCGVDTDLLTICDPALVYPAGSATLSSYGSGFDYDNSPSCCTGTWADHDSCTKDLIPFYDVYKAACPDAYVYAADDNYDDAVISCAGSPDYTITFCPNGNGQGTEPTAAAVAQDAGGSISNTDSAVSGSSGTSSLSSSSSSSSASAVAAAAANSAAGSSAAVVSGSGSRSAASASGVTAQTTSMGEGGATLAPSATGHGGGGGNVNLGETDASAASAVLSSAAVTDTSTLSDAATTDTTTSASAGATDATTSAVAGTITDATPAAGPSSAVVISSASGAGTAPATLLAAAGTANFTSVTSASGSGLAVSYASAPAHMSASHAHAHDHSLAASYAAAARAGSTAPVCAAVSSAADKRAATRLRVREARRARGGGT